MDMEDDEKMSRAEQEANLRQIYDPINGIFNFAKKRVTDSKHNTKVKLPGEVSTDLELYINLRRNKYKSVYQIQLDQLNEGVQRSNLPPDETAGLQSLSKKVKEGEVFVLKTDKSGKLVICTPEAYLEMGKEHTDKDVEIDMEGVKLLSEEVHRHTSTWLKMFNVGEGHGHSKKFRESYLGRDMPAPLYILVKDHKKMGANGLPKTRPVVTGCSSYNVGMSELCSEVLEGVFKNMKQKVGMISLEDLLSRLHNFNEMIEK